MKTQMSVVFRGMVCANIKSRNAYECLHDVALTTAVGWGGAVNDFFSSLLFKAVFLSDKTERAKDLYDT
jgi:hypothetical protein